MNNGFTTPAGYALACRRAGVSVVPTSRDKLPDFPRLPRNGDGKASWDEYKNRLASEQTISGWFADGTVGYGIVGGAVSGNLEQLDFDGPEGYPADTPEQTLAAFSAKVEAIQPGLMRCLSICKTLNDGRHVRYRCEEPVSGNTKLAEVPELDSAGDLVADRHGKVKPATLIETRGEGGYACGPGSPGYTHLSGPNVWELVTITAEERDILLSAARSFDQLGASGNLTMYAINADESPNSGKPGDDFNQRGDWQPILDALDLQFRYQDKTGCKFFRRVGSAHPIAANLGFGGKDLLRVFSSSLQIPHEQTYSKFAAYAHLHHNGDFSAAAADLRKQGYGRTTEQTGNPKPDSDPHSTPKESPKRQPLIINTVGELVAEYPHIRKPIIGGIGREGEIVNIISKSKVGKSWFGYGLALSVVTGSKWLGSFWCERGKVLLIDNELHRDNLAFRIPAVANAMGIDANEYHNAVHVCSLRGRLRTIFELDEILNETRRGEYSVVIIDALYRLFPDGMSENDNATMAAIYNALDRFAEDTGALIFIVHHASKGSQTGKDTTDVGAGAGAQSRAADGHLVLLPHEEENCVVLNAVVRSFAPPPAVVLRWNFPLWTPADDLDPNALKSTKLAQSNEVKNQRLEGKRRKVAEYLSQADLRLIGASKTNIRDHTNISHGLGEVLDSLVRDGTAQKCVITVPENGRSFDGWKLAEEDKTEGGAGLPDNCRIVFPSDSDPVLGEGGSARTLKECAPYPPSSPELADRLPDGFSPEDNNSQRMPTGKRRTSKKSSRKRPASTRKAAP